MQKLNYQPNSLARTLQGKKSQLVGLIFPSVNNPFYGELVAELEQTFFNYGYKCILCDSQNNPEKEKHYLKMLLANQVDGIIAGAHNINIVEYDQIDLPIIAFDRELSKKIPIVSNDNFQGGKLATEALINAGAHKIAILTGNNENEPTKNRLSGYKQAIKKANLQEYIFSFTQQKSTILKQQNIQEILKKYQFDGIFCTDDLTAQIVYNEAQKLNIKIPDDLKIIGYDGTKLIQNYLPYLSTIVQPINELATLTAELLIQRINNPKLELNHTYTLPNQLLQKQTLQ